jgi:pyruvate dehydrogenase complex dehydrogenase (E1) component
VRFLTTLLRDKQLGPRTVPILVDEARTFGMEGLFRQIGIYNPAGQQYTPVDKDQVMYYKEDKAGQILQEGINEAGGMSSWIAAATSYSTNNRIMVPFYVYYSMFGFQRIGDLAWAAGDMQARGFLLGGTSGRTTLNVWSCPSFNELARDGQDAERWNLLHPTDKPRVPFVTQQLEPHAGPVVASTDYMKSYAEQIRPFVPKGRAYKVLGTDGFGRSDFRSKLREHFEVNRHYIVVAALKALAEEGTVPAAKVAEAIAKYDIKADKINPLYA